jgi:hypothetical protein
LTLINVPFGTANVKNWSSSWCDFWWTGNILTTMLFFLLLL